MADKVQKAKKSKSKPKKDEKGGGGHEDLGGDLGHRPQSRRLELEELPGVLGVLACERGLRVNTRQRLFLAQQDQYVENARRGRPPAPARRR